MAQISAADPHIGREGLDVGVLVVGSGVDVDAGAGVEDKSRFMFMPASP
jgi:hypothetical protein